MAALGFCTNERSLAESAAERAHCLEQVATGLRNAARLQQFIDMTQPRPLVHMPVRIMGQDLELIAFEGDAPEDVIDAFCASVDADQGEGKHEGGSDRQAKEAQRQTHCAEPLLPIVRLIMGFDTADR